MSARSTNRPVQNTGHADLVDLTEGGTVAVMLGMRPLGGTQAFSPLGRETFVTDVDWVDDWPIPRPVELTAPAPTVTESFTFTQPAVLADPGWLAVRRTPAEVATVTDGRLRLHGEGAGMAAIRPVFLGRRQRHLATTTSCRLDPAGGVGGLAFRYDEQSWVAIEVTGTLEGTTVVARARIPGMAQDWSADLPAGEVELLIETAPVVMGSVTSLAEMMGADRVRLVARAGGQEIRLAELDGRSWTAETTASFTGRVFGVYAVHGVVDVLDLRYQGHDG
jgi:beta-xylosidase